MTSAFSFAQLCQPTFVNGCALWNTKSIELGSLSWTFDEVDCSATSITNDTTEISAGISTIMNVSSGNWCGCSVWVDFNKDNLLDNNENLYYAGNGSTEIELFAFNITIPANTVNGTYTMRVLTSWGSDGYTQGANGYGGCGDYQYGNYQDFPVKVVGGQSPASVSELSGSDFAVFPNPAMEQLHIETALSNDFSYIIFSGDGTSVSKGKSTGNIDIKALSSGVYFISINGSAKTQKFVKL